MGEYVSITTAKCEKHLERIADTLEDLAVIYAYNHAPESLTPERLRKPLEQLRNGFRIPKPENP